MKKKIIKTIIGLFSLPLIASCSKQQTEIVTDSNGPQIINGERATDGEDPFSEAGLYKEPELKIDGVVDKEYIEAGSGKVQIYSGGNEDTYVYLYKGENAIYFIFEAEDDSISCLDLEDINITTAQSDSCEIYIDAYGDGGMVRTSTDYEFRITASGRVYSMLTGFVAKSFIHGTNNFYNDVDEGFYIEGYVSYESLGPGVTKDTPTSFAFARVTKTGNKGYVWHGDVDPQIPNNYKVLHTDNKLYTLDAVPISGTISGKVTDTNGDPIPQVIVGGGKASTMTDSNGEYSLNFKDITEDLNLGFRKSGYLGYTKTISKSELRKANYTYSFKPTLLSQSQSKYSTTLTGVLTERDGKTPISGATVSANGSSATTDQAGKYSLAANLEGYSNEVSFQEKNHGTYATTLLIENINIGGTTEMPTVQLDESNGAEIEFGGAQCGKATARVVRNNDEKSFKIVMKTLTNMDPNEAPGSYFEFFLDTKESSGLDHRDATDYRFDIEYSDKGLLRYQNYGGSSINTENFKTTYGRINEMYFVEMDLPYDALNLTSNECIGVYFGIKSLYNWEGIYLENGSLLNPEITFNYFRLTADSKLVIGSTNIEPTLTKTPIYIDEIGNYSNVSNTVKYDISVVRENSGVVLVLENKKDSVSRMEQSHALNIYYDMNVSLSKTKQDSSCGHIEVYEGYPASVLSRYNDDGTEDKANKIYEINQTTSWVQTMGSKMYVYLSYELLGGNSTNTIGFTIGCWNTTANGNDWMTYNGKQPDFVKPSTYVFVDANGNCSIN